MATKNSLEVAGTSAEGPTEKTPLVIKPEGGSTDDESGKRNGGLTVTQTAVLLAGEMAGSGVLALPRALVKTGWYGVPLIILLAGVAAFCGQRLGECWSLLEERNPEMRTRKRKPYAIIVEQAMGKTWSVIVSLCILVTLFGAAVVVLLLATQIIEHVLLYLAPYITYCTWYLIVAGATSPLMLFGTPKDFSLLGIVAFGSTLVACVLFFIQMMNDIRPTPVFRYGVHGFQDFFLALGTIMFAFGGASTFPTIQNDMTDRKQFSKSVQYSFIGILILYLTMSITGYAVYGESVAPNFATSLTPSPLTTIGNILIAIHLFAAFIIIINPVCQEMEEMYKVPRDSVAGRFIVRMSIMLAVVFVGESIPRFHSILSLVGGTTVALLTFVLPPYCYMQLTSQSPPEGMPSKEVSSWMTQMCWAVMALGVVGGVIAGFSAINAIFNTAMVLPCYF